MMMRAIGRHSESAATGGVLKRMATRVSLLSGAKPYPFPAPSASESATINFSGGEFPSVDLHLQLLLHTLRQSDYEPTKTWISHVREHPGALLPELQKATQHNPRLTPAHHVVVKAEFGIRDNLSEREWAQVLGQIMARV